MLKLIKSTTQLQLTAEVTFESTGDWNHETRNNTSIEIESSNTMIAAISVTFLKYVLVSS
jgi:hypothetical protein